MRAADFSEGIDGASQPCARMASIHCSSFFTTTPAVEVVDSVPLDGAQRNVEVDLQAAAVQGRAEEDHFVVLSSVSSPSSASMANPAKP